MRETITILLFDVDGVIVDPRAYKIGASKTLELLCAKIGLTDSLALMPTDEEIAYFESCGVHDVWDITNILFCQILVSLSEKFAGEKVAVDLKSKSIEQQLQEFKGKNCEISRPDYLRLADQIAQTEGAPHPPDVALRVLSAEICAEPAARENWLELLNRFLKSTRSAYDSFGTRLFQNIILGSPEFARTYDLPSEYDGPSLLETEDVVFINQQSVSLLDQLRKRSDYRMAIYTARPSHPPKSEPIRVGYSPEAEMALTAANLLDAPLVAMGMMEWLAKRHNERTEDLTKPNRTQALAALIAACAGFSDIEILEEAYEVDKHNANPSDTHLRTLKEYSSTVFVFEDTTSGIKPLLKAAELLNQKGYEIAVRPLGIAKDENKKAALAPYCESVFANVNEALAFATGNVQTQS